MSRIYKVSSKTIPQKLAGAISSVIKDEDVRVNCIGAGALNNAIKAIAIARGFVVPSGIEIAVIPSFNDIILEGEEKTGISLLVFKR
jgi:stage V sporulation protein SpoVS